MVQKNKISIIVWCTFLLFLLSQYQLIYLYFDDFGLFSLSYGYDANIPGSKITFKALIDYAIHSYQYVNGRISAILVYVLLGWLGGLNIVRIFLPLTILFIYLNIYSLVINQKANKKAHYLSLAFLCFSYGLFGIQICNYGLYWFSAACVYVLPIAVFMVFDRLYQNNKIFAPLASFFLCLFSEQMAAMTMAYIGFDMGYKIFHREKGLKSHWFSLYTSVTAAFIMLMSPASRKRMINDANISFYNMNLYNKIAKNSIKVINNFFFRTGNIFVWFILAICILMAVQMILKNKFKLFYIFLIICTSIIMYLLTAGKIENNIETHVFLFLLYFICMFIGLFIYFINQDFHMATIVVGAAATIGILLIVPELPARTLIPCMFMFIIFGGRILTDYMDTKLETLIGMLMIPFILLNIQNLHQIYIGYQSNVEILEYNHFKLTEASEQLKCGHDITTVELYKIPQPTYAGQQVYSEKVSFMKFWIDQYYELPYTIEYIYYDYPSKENAIQICFVK